MDNTNEIITESNEVYRNSFDAMEFSNWGTGVNKSDEGIGVGLEYNCNDNLNTSFYYFVVVGKGVSEFQGGFTSGGIVLPIQPILISFTFLMEESR
jgi:hypothetical protein